MFNAQYSIFKLRFQMLRVLYQFGTFNGTNSRALIELELRRARRQGFGRRGRTLVRPICYSAFYFIPQIRDKVYDKRRKDSLSLESSLRLCVFLGAFA